MKRIALVLAVLTLSSMLWAAGNAGVDLRPAANLQPTICSFKSPDAITIPRMLSYQGKLTDTFGLPVVDTTYSVAFRLYTQPTGGSPFWNETQTVRTRSGLFSVLLGSVTPISALPEAGGLFLGMKVGADLEMLPRVRVVSAAYSFLAGDARHADTADYAVASGLPDSIPGDFVVGGELRTYGRGRFGTDCHLAGTNSFVFGNSDSVTGNASVVGGGSTNRAGAHYTTVCGGYLNRAMGLRSAIGGGFGNEASGVDAAVCAGRSNRASDSSSTVAGGANNTAYSRYASVGGGLQNRADSAFATVSGGDSNLVSGWYAAIGGGQKNEASEDHCVVGGGESNEAAESYATVAGGYGGQATGSLTSIGGGFNNSATASGAAVGGGQSNEATGGNSVIPGGLSNDAVGYISAIGGGYRNQAGGNSSDSASCVAGGSYNVVTGDYSAIGGGYYNQISGRHSTVPGGYADSISTDYSMAAGSRVKVGASADYTFAFGYNFVTTTPYAVVFCHNGQTTKLGVGVDNPTHNIDVAGGAYCNGTNWINGSARKFRDNIAALTPVEMADLLDDLGRAEVVRYTYKSEDGGEEHIGLVAEDAPEAIATPARDGINTADAIGWLVAVAKAQQAEIDALKAKLAGK